MNYVLGRNFGLLYAHTASVVWPGRLDATMGKDRSLGVLGKRQGKGGFEPGAATLLPPLARLGVPGSRLLLLGEFQRVAEDLERRLLIIESTCLGRLTAEREHLPAPTRGEKTHGR